MDCKKILDFLWKKARLRLRIEGKTHIGRYLFVMFGETILQFMFGWLLGAPENADISEYQESIKRFLRLHRRHHQFVGNKPCSLCYVIAYYSTPLRKFVVDPKLYPPFKF